MMYLLALVLSLLVSIAYDHGKSSVRTTQTIEQMNLRAEILTQQTTIDAYAKQIHMLEALMGGLTHNVNACRNSK